MLCGGQKKAETAVTSRTNKKLLVTSVPKAAVTQILIYGNCFINGIFLQTENGAMIV